MVLRQLSTYSAVHGLLTRLGGLSAMGAYECPMDVLNVLINCKPAARTLVNLPAWLPTITRCSIRVGVGPSDDTSRICGWYLHEQCRSRPVEGEMGTWAPAGVPGIMAMLKAKFSEPTA